MPATTISWRPLWYAREVMAVEEEAAAKERKKIGPNDQIVMGAIGVGVMLAPDPW